MEDSKNLRWNISWEFSFCSSCSSALREQLSSSNRCAMIIGYCHNWCGTHTTSRSLSLIVAAKTHVGGKPDYGWKLSNASRRKLLERLDREFPSK